MKKISYNTKSKDELTTELKALRSALQSASASSRTGKNSKAYTTARKNIARVLTALTAKGEHNKNSTEVEK